MLSWTKSVSLPFQYVQCMNYMMPWNLFCISTVSQPAFRSISQMGLHYKSIKITCIQIHVVFPCLEDRSMPARHSVSQNFQEMSDMSKVKLVRMTRFACRITRLQMTQYWKNLTACQCVPDRTGLSRTFWIFLSHNVQFWQRDSLTPGSTLKKLKYGSFMTGCWNTLGKICPKSVWMTYNMYKFPNLKLQ